MRFALAWVWLLLAVTAQAAPHKKRPLGGCRSLPVLCYHEVGPSANLPLTTPIKDFLRHMDYLKKEGYTPVRLEDARLFYWGAKDLPGKPILITFDDGYEGIYKYAMPVLARYRFPATIFLVVGRVGQQEPIPHVTWEQCKKLKDSGLVEFGSHTYDLHCYIRERLALGGVYPDQVVKDLRQSRATLKEKLDVDANAFAWPYGHYDSRCLELAAKAGFNMQFTIDFGATVQREGTNRIRRYNVMEDDNPISTFRTRLRMCSRSQAGKT